MQLGRVVPLRARLLPYVFELRATRLTDAVLLFTLQRTHTHTFPSCLDLFCGRNSQVHRSGSSIGLTSGVCGRALPSKKPYSLALTWIYSFLLEALSLKTVYDWFLLFKTYSFSRTTNVFRHLSVESWPQIPFFFFFFVTRKLQIFLHFPLSLTKNVYITDSDGGKNNVIKFITLSHPCLLTPQIRILLKFRAKYLRFSQRLGGRLKYSAILSH